MEIIDVIDVIVNSVKNIKLSSILDILVVSYIFYKSYILIKETRAEQLLKGIIFIKNIRYYQYKQAIKFRNALLDFK